MKWSASMQTAEPVAWALFNECENEITTDPEIADYWKRKGRSNFTALYAAPDRAPSTDSAAEARPETDVERLERQARFRKTTICGVHKFDECNLVFVKCGYAWGADKMPAPPAIAALQPEGEK
jgi:hypothetical protein